MYQLHVFRPGPKAKDAVETRIEQVPKQMQATRRKKQVVTGELEPVKVEVLIQIAQDDVSPVLKDPPQIHCVSFDIQITVGSKSAVGLQVYEQIQAHMKSRLLLRPPSCLSGPPPGLRAICGTL